MTRLQIARSSRLRPPVLQRPQHVFARDLQALVVALQVCSLLARMSRSCLCVRRPQVGLQQVTAFESALVRWLLWQRRIYPNARQCFFMACSCSTGVDICVEVRDMLASSCL